MSDLLQFVWFKDLTTWSVNNYISINNINTKYDLVKISEILQQVKNNEILEDKTNYKLSGIHSRGKGLFHRDIKLGKDIKSRNLNKLQTNQFIYSRLGSHTGSFDVVDNKFNNYYVSNEIPTFEFINNNIEAHFLKLVFSLKKYWQDIEKSLQGTAHKRFKEKDFLNIKIPLPPLKIQQKLVKNYQNKLNLAKQQTQQAQQKEAEIETYLYQVLGIELPKNEKQNNDILQFVLLKDLGKWSVKDLLAENTANSKIYNTVTLSHVVLEQPKYGSNSRGVKKITDTRYIRITDISEDGMLNNEVVSAEATSKQYLLKQNDFLIARSGNTVGKTFLYDKKYGKCLYAGYLIKFVLNTDIINPIYLLFYSKSTLYKKWVIGNLRVAGQPNINSQEYLTSPIILPPLKIQNQIANHIQNIKDEITELKQQAEQNQKNALTEFEAEIFNAS